MSNFEVNNSFDKCSSLSSSDRLYVENYFQWLQTLDNWRNCTNWLCNIFDSAVKDCNFIKRPHTDTPPKPRTIRT